MANIGLDVYSGFKKARLEALTSLDDWADRLSYLYSVLILSVSIAIVSLKTYYFSPLVCYLPTKPGGSQFSQFFTELCLVEGTIAIQSNSSIPNSVQEWDALESTERTNYYYWIPFMLGMQLILFYFPHFIWSSITHNRMGTDLANLLNQAQTARSDSNPDSKRKITKQIAEQMSMLFYTHRNINDNCIRGIKQSCGDFIGIILCSKRLGTWTVASYLLVKLMYLANAIGQLFLMKKFLSFSDNIHSFGIELASRISLVDDWETSKYFPRTSICRVSARMVGSSSTNFVGLCAMPINLFNEKIYVLLWFWVTYVATCTAISIPIWIINSGSSSRRRNRIMAYFILDTVRLEEVEKPKGECKVEEEERYNDYITRKNLLETHYPTDEMEIDKFINNYLRADGVFLLDMIDQHVGDIIAGEIARYLYINYLDYYDYDFDGMFEDSSEDLCDRDSKSSSIDEGITLQKNTNLLRAQEI